MVCMRFSIVLGAPCRARYATGLRHPVPGSGGRQGVEGNDVTADELQRELGEPMTPRHYDALLARLKAVDSATAFDCLFTVALTPKKYGHDQWASRLLVE